MCNYGKMFKNIYTFAPIGLQYLLHTWALNMERHFKLFYMGICFLTDHIHFFSCTNEISLTLKCQPCITTENKDGKWSIQFLLSYNIVIPSLVFNVYVKIDRKVLHTFFKCENIARVGLDLLDLSFNSVLAIVPFIYILIIPWKCALNIYT